MCNTTNTTSSRQQYDGAISNQVRELDSKQDTNSVSNSVSKSVSNLVLTAGARACARTREDGIVSPDDLEAIRNAYVRNVGQPLTAMVAREIEAALDEGMRPSVVIEAAVTTGNAPRPTPYYMRAVLRRWRRDGIFTDDALAADRAAYEARQAATPQTAWWQQTNPALRYNQRAIEDENELYTDLSTLKA